MLTTWYICKKKKEQKGWVKFPRCTACVKDSNIHFHWLDMVLVCQNIFSLYFYNDHEEYSLHDILYLITGRSEKPVYPVWACRELQCDYQPLWKPCGLHQDENYRVRFLATVRTMAYHRETRVRFPLTTGTFEGITHTAQRHQHPGPSKGQRTPDDGRRSNWPKRCETNSSTQDSRKSDN